MNTNEIRNSYLDFFAKRGHKPVNSDSLIPSGDPTLLFTSAGMVQFKNNFLGKSSDAFTSAVSCQKCMRTSDIDQVGITNRHLTFFEMLGNFSFGDYFKKEAIAWAWEFLTEVMELSKDNLYITVYKDDNEAYDIWKKIVLESKIIRMGEETNFWNMGPTGPCGPCSEILFDLGEEMSCGKPDCSPACSCNRYLEVWNLVFTQFDRKENGQLENLPRKNIDTGMGLERLAAVKNGKTNVFDTDLFQPTAKSIAAILEIAPSENTTALRMMTDHCRAITFLISDGVLPSNEGRGYILRRILRRALRQGKLLGYDKPFLYKATAEIIKTMETAYPDLKERRESIASITKLEEENFLETIEAGSKMMDEIIRKYKNMPLKTSGVPIIPGEEVFKLYDTHGFPPDLTREIAIESGFTIDEEGFKKAQKAAQDKSRAAWSGSGEKDLTFYSVLNRDLGGTTFSGYDKLSLETKVIALIKNGNKVESLKVGEEGEAVLKDTPFYAESGGQVGDKGHLKTGDSITAEVIEVKKPVSGLIIHGIKVIKGELTVGQNIITDVDSERRKDITRHHTATHLLHKALRKIIGTHVTQAGSLVAPDYFRFDFTHPAALTLDEIEAVEEIVNEAIRENMSVHISEMPIEEARKAGAMALFGEKYGDTVRTVTMRQDTEKTAYSMELCGGTHVARTGDIGTFKISSEYSVSAGTRRIEGFAGKAAEKHIVKLEKLIDDISEKLKTPKSELVAKIDRTLAQQKDLEKEIVNLKSQIASQKAAGFIDSVREINGVKLLTGNLDGTDNKSLRSLADDLRTKLGSGIVILTSTERNEISFVVALTADIKESGFNAGKIAKNFATLIDGSGGGKSDFAQGGGKNISMIKPAFEKISGMLK